MAKHEQDAVLRELIHSVNESGLSTVPITVSAGGAILRGFLIAQDQFFADLMEGVPLMGALNPGAGLLGEKYVQDVSAQAGHFLHLRAARLDGDSESTEGLWRIRLNAVDAWTLRAGGATAGSDDKGPFARLLSNS